MTFSADSYLFRPFCPDKNAPRIGWIRGAVMGARTAGRSGCVRHRGRGLFALTACGCSLAVDRVDDLTRTARSIAEDVEASVHGVQQESQLRYIVLALGWLFILFTSAVAYLYRKERKRERT